MKIEVETVNIRQVIAIHPSSLRPHPFWPDSGLTRNTRCRCYRCSVPGLAGFTRRALCGARSLIKKDRLPTKTIANCRLPIADCQFVYAVRASTSMQTLMHVKFMRCADIPIGNRQLAVCNVKCAFCDVPGVAADR